MLDNNDLNIVSHLLNVSVPEVAPIDTIFMTAIQEQNATVVFNMANATTWHQR
jgi:hypothetical protein